MGTEWTVEKIDALPNRLHAARLWIENAVEKPIHNHVLPQSSVQRAVQAIIEHLEKAGKE